MDVLRDLLFVLWVFAPAGVANVVPIIVAPVPGLRRWTAPLDGGRIFRGRRILGDHKTWRGLITGVIGATAVLALQALLVTETGWAAWLADGLDYGFGMLPAVLLAGPLFAIGALGGDAVKSFFKRQIGMAPGHSWPVFDQVDYALGAALAVLPFVRLTLLQYVLLIVAWGGISLFSSWVGYLVHLKNSPN